MIKLYNVVLKESPLDSPFAPKDKRWVAAAITAAAAIFDGIMNQSNFNSAQNQQDEMNSENIKMQRETNEMNKQLVNATNAQNYRMFQEQQAYNYDMWNKTNEYNKPKNQVQRLLEAGINPASYFGTSTGSIASQISSPNANPAGAPHMDAPRNYFEARQAPASQLANGSQAAVNAYNENRLMQAETKNKEALTGNTVLDNTYKMRGMEDNLKRLHSIAQGSGWQADLAKDQLAFYHATMDYEIQMKYGDMMMQQQSFQQLANQMRYQELQNQILEITKGYAKELNQANLAQIWSTVHQANAQIGLINANKLLTDAQKDSEIERKTSVILDNGLKGLDFNVKKTVEDAIIQSYRNDANEGMARAFNTWKYNPSGDNRTPTEIFQMDNLPDFMKRQFLRKGYVPKF